MASFMPVCRGHAGSIFPDARNQPPPQSFTSFGTTAWLGVFHDENERRPGSTDADDPIF